MPEKQTLLQLGREKLNSSVPKFLQTEVSMKGLRNLAVAGLVSSAAIFGGEKLNKMITLSPDQISVASTTIEKAGLGGPSQFSKALEANKNGATVQQISEARSKLISPNPETSKLISDDLMERFNSNPNTDNLIALYQSLGEQNPQLKSKFDQAVKELGQNPDSQPTDWKQVAKIIAMISGGVLIVGEAKNLLNNKSKPVQESDTVIDETNTSKNNQNKLLNPNGKNIKINQSEVLTPEEYTRIDVENNEKIQQLFKPNRKTLESKLEEYKTSPEKDKDHKKKFMIIFSLNLIKVANIKNMVKIDNVIKTNIREIYALNKDLDLNSFILSTRNSQFGINQSLINQIVAKSRIELDTVITSERSKTTQN
jgi:hypothetical protein